VRTAFGINALIGKAQSLDWPAAYQVLFDNGGRILRRDRTVPYCFRVHHHGRPVFALIQTQGFVDAYPICKACGFGQLLQLGVQLAFTVRCARRTGRAGGADVMANKDMSFKRGQSRDPPLLD